MKNAKNKNVVIQSIVRDVIMGAIASQITSLTIAYSTVYSDADQRKHQSSASLAFVWGIHRGSVNSPHKWPVTRKMFPFEDVIMLYYNLIRKYIGWSVIQRWWRWRRPSGGCCCCYCYCCCRWWWWQWWLMVIAVVGPYAPETRLTIKLWLTDAISWWHRSGSTLVQVMPWCLATPSHYLNQYWLLIKSVLCHSHETNGVNS